MEAGDIAGLGVGLAVVGISAHFMGKMMNTKKKATKHTKISNWL